MAGERETWNSSSNQIMMISRGVEEDLEVLVQLTLLPSTSEVLPLVVPPFHLVKACRNLDGRDLPHCYWLVWPLSDQRQIFSSWPLDFCLTQKCSTSEPRVNRR